MYAGSVVFKLTLLLTVFRHHRITVQFLIRNLDLFYKVLNFVTILLLD